MATSDILVMKNITKKFPGVTALKDVNFSCREAEIHALMGENGAGKSTLMKLLNGLSHPTSGEIFFNGESFNVNSPTEAQKKGIVIIYQELNLVSNLNAVENIFLGREITKNGFILFPKMKKKAKEILESLNTVINLDIPIKFLSVAQQQMVEIAKALSMEASLLVMDEPTASLTNSEIESLYTTMRTLKKNGVSIIFISHHLNEIFEIADRVSILKDGEYMGTKDINDIDEKTLIKMMVGRNLEEIYPQKAEKAEKDGDRVMELKNVTRKSVLNNICLDIYKGQILGIAGLVGAGRTELARAIFGADKLDSGEIFINGSKVIINKPRDAMKHHIGFVTEDRKFQGLILGLSIKHNVSLTFIKLLTKFRLINGKKEKDVVGKYSRSLKIAAPNCDTKCVSLSGGNQQKVVLAKWLARDCKIIILDEPTRGIDIGAKVEIYNLMRKLANEGVAIIMISSELPEVLGMSDRIAVMRNGCVAGLLDCEEATEERILEFAMGTECKC